MVCLLVPLVVKAVFSSDVPNQIQQWIKDRLGGKKDYFVRSISCVAIQSSHCLLRLSFICIRFLFRFVPPSTEASSPSSSVDHSHYHHHHHHHNILFILLDGSYETKSGGGYYYSQSDDLDSKERNNLLQKAIRLYLSEVCHFSTNTADVFLIPARKIKLEKDRWGDECRFSGSYQQLMSYQVRLLLSSCTLSVSGVAVH